MRIDVEQEFGRCVRAMGGVVLDDVVVPAEGKTPSVADYWFPDHGAIVELKCLTVDTIAGQALKDRAQELYAGWISRGLVPPRARSVVRYNVRDLPLECAREMLSYLKRTFEHNVVAKANAQIKSTKKLLGRPDAKGLLLLANDGNLSFTPHLTMGLLNHSLRRAFSSIHSAIYFSVNVDVSFGADADRLAPFWIDGVIPERQVVPTELRDALQEAWMRHVAEILGAPVELIDRSGIEEADFVSGSLTHSRKVGR